MDPAFDTIIVGGGLAGACAALHLSRQERVLVLEADRPAAGASGAAAGLVNPLMGQKAKPVWRMDDALDALHETLTLADATSLFQESGLLRPATDDRQARFFQETAATQPQHAAWFPADAVDKRFPGVAVHDGALWVRRGGTIRVPTLVEALLAGAQRRGAQVRMGSLISAWDETTRQATVATRHGERLSARRVVLALGYGYHRHPELAALNLHAVKGQTVRVAVPDQRGWNALPPLSGYGYVVPDGETLVVGSSYERDFTDLRPSVAQTREILAKAARMLPGLEHADVLEATAGVRVTVPGTRLPMVGPLPDRSRIWLFTGLGSKGLLMAPLLARDLAQCFEQPERIPATVRVATRAAPS